MAIGYAKVAEEETIEHIRRVYDWEFAGGSRICIMQYVHAGMGGTLGKIRIIWDRGVSNIAGVDIECGIYTINLGKWEIDFEKLDEAAYFFSSGKNVWEGRQQRFDQTNLRCYKSLRDTKRMERSLGILGA